MKPRNSLSDRELQVVELLAYGYTQDQIASQLYLSVHTVKSHIGKVLRSLDAHNSTHAVVVAHELGLLPLQCCCAPIPTELLQ